MSENLSENLSENSCNTLSGRVDELEKLIFESNINIERGWRSGSPKKEISKFDKIYSVKHCRLKAIESGAITFTYRSQNHKDSKLKNTCSIYSEYPTEGKLNDPNEHLTGCTDWKKNIDNGCN